MAATNNSFSIRRHHYVLSKFSEGIILKRTKELYIKLILNKYTNKRHSITPIYSGNQFKNTLKKFPAKNRPRFSFVYCIKGFDMFSTGQKSMSDLKTQEIIANIRKIREFRNYTQDYLAAKLNISQNAYSKIELGYSSITLNRLINIAGILEISLVELINFSGEDVSFMKLTEKAS